MIKLILPLITILDFWDGVGAWIGLFLDEMPYTILAGSLKVFTTVSTINFNTIYGIAQPIVDKIQAVVIVFVVYQLGLSFIKYMINPDDFVKDGTKFLKNLVIATALFVSYNFIFSVFNELNILLVGNPGYDLVTLPQVFGIDPKSAQDKGLVMTLMFGKDAPTTDRVGQDIAVSIASIFVRDLKNGEETGTSNQIQQAIVDLSTGNVKFSKLVSLHKLAKSENIKYHIGGIFVVLYISFVILNSSLQIAVRMFKLLILQVLAPLVIVDVIQNGVEGEKCKSYIKTYLSVFIEAFVRMLVILITAVFASKFLAGKDIYLPTLAGGDNFGTQFVVLIVFIVAAFAFSSKVPEFIDKVLGTSIASEGMGNLVGNLLGGAIGGVAGFAGGMAGGGLGAGLMGLASGTVGGWQTGGKGKGIVDAIKARKDIGSNAKGVGERVASSGGFWKYAAGHTLAAAGIRGVQDRRSGKFGVALDMIKEYDEKTSSYIKDQDWKAFSSDDSKTPKALRDIFTSLQKNVKDYGMNGKQIKFTENINGLTIGSDKDAFKANMRENSETVLAARSNVDRIKALVEKGELKGDGSTYDEDLQKAYGDLQEAIRKTDDFSGDYFDSIKRYIGAETEAGKAYAKRANEALKSAGVKVEVKNATTGEMEEVFADVTRDLKSIKTSRNATLQAQTELEATETYRVTHPRQKS